MLIGYARVSTVNRTLTCNATLHDGQERLGFEFNGLGQELPRAAARHIRQGIVDILGLTKADNVGRVGHGVLCGRPAHSNHFSA